MAFTRYHDDPLRITKQLQESTGAGRYQLDTPGPGVSMPYFADPQYRLQKWGANMVSDSTNLESEFRCLGAPLNHDYDRTYIQTNLFSGSPYSFPVTQEHVQESRASHPAWMYKDLEQSRWETPFINPLAHLEKEFPENISTRILAKDHYVPEIPSVIATEPVQTMGRNWIPYR